MTEAFVDTYAGLYLVVFHRFEGTFAEGVVPLCKIWEHGEDSQLSYGVDRWRVWPTFEFAFGNLVKNLLNNDHDWVLLSALLSEAQKFTSRCRQYCGAFNPGKSWVELVNENRMYPAHGIDAYAAGMYDNMVARSVVRKRPCPPWTEFVPNLQAVRRLELLQSLLMQADNKALSDHGKKSEVLR